MSDLVPLPSQRVDVPWPTEKWPEGELDSAVDAAALDELLAYAFSQPEEMQQTNAFLAVHRGRLVLERYAEDVDAETTHISWSMAKSVLHATCGLLVGDGELDIDARAEIALWQEEEGDPRQAITVDQLLKMRSGLRFLEDYTQDSDSMANVIEMLFGKGKDDVARYAASCPLAHDPGSFYYYSSGTSNVISKLVGDRLGPGDGVQDYVHSRLFAPLGMQSPTLRFDEAGTWIASSFVFATARDFARFGLLYLRDGCWEGQRILPEGWVDHGRRLSDPAEADTFSYGAHWWVVPGSLGTFQAQGYNGQRITVVPALDLVLVRLGVTPIEYAPRMNQWMKEVVDAFRPAR